MKFQITLPLLLLFSFDLSAELNPFTVLSEMKKLNTVKEKVQEIYASKVASQSMKSTTTPTGFPDDFIESKVYLKKMVRENNPKTLYLGCDIDSSQKSLKPILDTCGFVTPRGTSTSMQRFVNQIHMEHVVPASWLGGHLDCWKRGGRKNCNKTSDQFNIMEADLINLHPSIGLVNMNRSNYQFTDKAYGEDYGSGGSVVFSPRSHKLKPNDEDKGHIGRIHLYMVDQYGVYLKPQYLSQMQQWASLPASDWECQYNDILQEDFGFSNKYSTRVCSF